MATYTIKSVNPTGKPDAGFGVPYYIQFEEDARTVYAQKKTTPQVGDVWDGDIVDDKYGFKFKKAPFVPGSGSNHGATPAVAPARPAYKDNSDGMRQGMCFNNAANFVNNLVFDTIPTDREWADTVYSYAQALYRKGDLNVVSEGSQEVPETVANVFGAQ